MQKIKKNYRKYKIQEDEAKIAKEDRLKTYFITNRDDLPKITEEHITNDDLILNFYPNIQDSLFMNTVIQRSSKEPQIFQIIQNEYEYEIFYNTGVRSIITPDMLMTRSMFLIFLATKKMGFSSIQVDRHSFEYKVSTGDKFDEQSIEEINKIGYDVLLMKRASNGKIINNPNNIMIRKGDALILSTSIG